MTVEIKGIQRFLNVTDSLVCDYKDVTIKEVHKRNGFVNQEIRIQPEGCKRAKVFATSYYHEIIMFEATTGKTMIHWSR